MLVAVIGGTRHVGPSIVKLLVEAGHQVAVYNRGRTPAQLPSGVQRFVVDRKVPGQLAAALRDHPPDAIIDMIGYIVEDVEEVYSALPSLLHYVFCSTTAVYDRIGKTTPDESTPVAPYDSYPLGKVACEQFLTEKYHSSSFPTTILRLAHPYGPRDHLLYTAGREALFLDRMRHSRPIIIPGSGQTRIHPIYVEDAARAFVHVLGRPECMGCIYNLAGEQILTLDEYFASIARVLGVPFVARKFPADFFKDNAHLWAEWRRQFNFGANWVNYESAFDTSALQRSGFRCHTDHDTGVALTLEWLDANRLIPQSSDEDEEDMILSQTMQKNQGCADLPGGTAR